MKDYIAGFGLFLKSQQAASNSIRAYLGDLKAFAAWFEGFTHEPFDPASTVRRDLLDWRDELARTFKPATVNRKLSSLRIFFDWAGRQGWITSDPTSRVHGLPPRPSKFNAPDEAAVEKILQLARTRGSARDRAMLELLAATGLRLSEILSLHRSNLELGEASAWLNVPACKGRRTRRIPVSVRARVALKEYLEERGGVEKEAPLFLTRQGKAMTAYAVWYALKKYAAETGDQEMSPRSLRNVLVAKLAANPEIGLVSAAAFLGQNRLEVLARHVQAEDLMKTWETR